jgi:hypothetical protein
MDLKRLALVGLTLWACAPARTPGLVSGRLPGTDGASHPIVDPEAKFTVVEFFSAHCPCQAQHDARLRELVKRYRGQGIAFVAIDSEADATVSRDRAEAARRGYPYVILVDPEGTAARAMKADYATYSLLVDRAGTVLFRGGIDSDRSHLRDDATPYLQNAIDDVLAARPVRLPEAKTLGCSLMLK